jgi:hypothetical protein
MVAKPDHPEQGNKQQQRTQIPVAEWMSHWQTGMNVDLSGMAFTPGEQPM